MHTRDAGDRLSNQTGFTLLELLVVVGSWVCWPAWPSWFRPSFSRHARADAEHGAGDRRDPVGARDGHQPTAQRRTAVRRADRRSDVARSISAPTAWPQGQPCCGRSSWRTGCSSGWIRGAGGYPRRSSGALPPSRSDAGSDAPDFHERRHLRRPGRRRAEWHGVFVDRESGQQRPRGHDLGGSTADPRVAMEWPGVGGVRAMVINFNETKRRRAQTGASDAGFSLIETMIAMAILATGLLSLAGVFIMGTEPSVRFVGVADRAREGARGGRERAHRAGHPRARVVPDLQMSAARDQLCQWRPGEVCPGGDASSRPGGRAGQHYRRRRMSKCASLPGRTIFSVTPTMWRRTDELLARDRDHRMLLAERQSESELASRPTVTIAFTVGRASPSGYTR